MAKKRARREHKPSNFNFVVISGYVVDIGSFNYKGRLGIRARIKINQRSKVYYIDTYGFNSTAEVMSITCLIGNQVYIEGKVCTVEADSRKKLVPFIKVEYCECLLRRGSVKEPQLSMISLLDNLDPVNYLSKPKFKRKKNGKNRECDDNDDEE